MIDQIIFYLQFPFIRNAIIVGLLVSLCSSLLGVTLVLKRYSFIGDGLSHVAFGAMTIATVLSLTNKMILLLPVTVIAAILMLRNNDKSAIKGDAAIALISVSALAFGYLLMNMFPSSNNVSGDVCSSLFGSTSILTLSRKEVWLSVVLSVVVVVFFIFFHNRIFSVTFDQDFASATGINVRKYDTLIAIIIAIIIVLAINLVGSLLISALIIFPALSAMRLFDSFRNVTIFSAVFSVICTLTGMLIAILAKTPPVGATIVAVNVFGFLICSLIGMMKGK